MVQLLTDQLRMMAGAYPDQAACIDAATDHELTFASWEGRSNQLARGLMSLGVTKGDRVAIHIPPKEAMTFLVSYSAVHKAGAVAVPTSTRLVARELGYVLDHAGVVVAVSGETTTPVLAEARTGLAGLRTVVTTGTPSGPSTVAWDDALDPDGSELQVPLDGDDIADVMYTSGTTGRPKGVVVRHRSVSMLRNGLPRWSGAGWLHASPMSTFAGIASTYSPMKLGMVLLYLPRFDVDGWFDVVERRRPAATFLVPAMAELLVASPRFVAADLSSITICSLGSAPVAPATLKRLQDKLSGAMVSNAWGMTEAGPAFCFMPPEEQARRIGSVGKAMAPTEFRIVDDDGNRLPPRQIGELIVRNPGREREYLNDPAATASTWRDGWLHSGDLAHLDEDGFLYIVGRRKDVIIRGGNNVHATDVEGVLYEHPVVREAAVAGVAHAVLGEDIGAWIVLAPGATTTAEELKEFCAERLSDYKVPRTITFVPELPRNATGKVLKGDLPGRDHTTGTRG